MQPKTLTLNKIPRIGPRLPQIGAKPTIKTELGTYSVVEFAGKNESGYRDPVGDRVLILPDQPQNDGLITLPDDLLERIALAAETGVIVALGNGAFARNSDRSPFVGEKPKVGTRVLFERYAGMKVLGRDGNWYRCMDDRCIGLFAE